MDPPENSGNRFGRTIWTVWGYLSGAVARYLRPEVTEDGNQSVRTRTDDIGLKSTVNKIDREVKANNSDNEGKKTHQNDSIEIKCSPSKVQVASAQWENTDVVKDDNNDELEHVHTTKTQLYHCAVWSTGTDTDNERHTGDAHAEKETVSSDEVPAEKVCANGEFEERETAQELEETEKTGQKDGHNEECDQNHEDEKCVKRREDADNADVTVQSEQDVEWEKQMNMTDHKETECIAGFKLLDEHLIGEKDKIVDQKDQEKAENDEELRLDSPDLLPQMKPFAEEANALSELERLEVITKYSDEIADVSKNEVKEKMHETGSATEQDEENRTAQELEESEQLEQKDADNESECDQNHEDERCVMAREDLDNADVMVQSKLYGQDEEQEKQICLMDHAETENIGSFKLADEHPIDEKEKHVVDQKDQEKAENDKDQGTESQVQDLLSQMEYFTEEADDFAKLDRLEAIAKYSDEIADDSKNEVKGMMPKTGSATEQDEENRTAQELEESGQLEQKDGDNEDEECDQNHEDERRDIDNADVMVQSELYGKDEEQEKISLMDHTETEDIEGFKLADEHPIDEKEKHAVDQKDQEKAENDKELRLDSPDFLPQMKPFAEEANALSELERLEVITKYSDEIADVSKNEVEEKMHETGSATEQDEENRTAQELEESEQLEQKDGDNEGECDQNHEDERCDMAREDLDNADVMVQSELYGQDEEQEKISLMDHAETEDIGSFKLADEHPIDEKEKHVVDQKDQEKAENDKDQGTESQVQDLLPQMEYFTEEADDFAKLDRLEAIAEYSDEIADVSKNEVEEKMPKTGSATEQDEENRTAQELEESGQLEQKDGDNEDEECDQNHEDERRDMAREDLDNADVMVQSELYGQDEEQEKISLMDHTETEDVGGFKLADEHPIDEKEKHVVDQKDQEKAENDEDQGTESQVQDLLSQMEYFAEEAYALSKLDRLEAIAKYSDEIADDSKNEVKGMMPKTGSATEQDEENRTAQELEESGQLDQKDGDNEDEECDQNHEDERRDIDNADVMVQSELYGKDEEQEKISLMDHAETEDVGGFKLADEHPIDEKEKNVVEQKDQEIIENDEDQGTESQVQDLLSQMEYFTQEADDLAKPERLKSMENYSDEIDEFSKKGVEEMMLGTEQDEDTTESKQDVTKNELTESVETLQRVSEELSEKTAPNEEPELNMTTVDETIDPLEDTLLSDSKRDTPENTPETGTEGMFSDLMVCEFPGELRKGPETALAETDLGCFEEIKTNLSDSLAEEQAKREAVVAYSVEHSETLKAFQTEQDTETVIESSGTTENQEVDKTEVSLKEHVELRTELIVKTIQTEISSEDEEAFETESQSPIVRNVTFKPHELLEFTERQCKSSQGTMDPFNETQGNSSVSEIAGTAKIEQEDQRDVSTMSLSPVDFLEESLDVRRTEEQEILETDVAKTALDYVEEITNQVLKEMTKTEFNVEQKTEPLVGLSTEEPGDAEYQGAAQCLSADVFVLEEERKLLGETMDSRVEMETTSSEVVKQNEQHISSPECETTEADGRHEHLQKSIAGETVLSSHEDLMEVSRSGMKRVFDQVSTDLPERKTEGQLDLYLQAFEDSSLDFTLQKARIAVKNPQVRPPKDPRKLLFKASLDPLLPQTSPYAQKVEVSAPSKGLIGFKLPGLGAGLPILRKTEFGQKAREGEEAERTLQTSQTSVAVTEDSVKQEQVPAKPKWTPPKHPGMGSPFMMAELKSKLKKPVQE